MWPRAAPGVGVSLRRDQKEATRQRVLEAARELFDAEGYEQTTVRSIARRAEVSVGSVFTTFSCKRDILAQVMQDRLAALYAELDRVAPKLRGSTSDRLRSIFAIHYAFEAHRTNLFLSYIASAFDNAPTGSPRPREIAPRLWQILQGCLLEGRDRGEVDAGADLDLLTDLLMSAYVWTYRLAACENADAESMSKVMDRSIGVIAAGFAPRGGSPA
jgi:TetR/AcrR family transcriptional regulator, cholesterol catabolism regulator